MSASIVISIIAGLLTFITSLLVFTFYISGRLTKIESTQLTNKEHIADLITNTKDSIMASVRLMMSDERISIEHRFDEIEKNVEHVRNELKAQIQSERHNINNVGQKIQMHMEQHKHEIQNG